ncbi:MAG: nucleoside recognition domain-containing protein [Desulfovibrio alaskensis]|nr:nucleoside recognition domain-containing protein [Oleidesulfovibrio alaskensis]
MSDSMQKQSSTAKIYSRRTGRGRKTLMFVPLLCGISALGIILHADPALLHWQYAWPELVRPLIRMLIYLAMGLAVGLVVEGAGWAPFLARLARPLTRWGGLGQTSGAAFATAFVSGTAANTMLMEAMRDGRISLRELRIAYLINTGLPVFLLHLPTTFFIVVPMTRTAGAIYLALNGTAALCRTLGLLAWARATAHRRQSGQSAAPEHSGRLDLNRVAALFRRRFSRIILFTAPVYFLIYALTQAGVFEAMRQAAAQGLSWSFLPVEAASVVIFAVAAEFTSGIAAAGALLDAGSLTTAQTVTALILGTIAATPVRALRHQLPSHAGIFTPRLGLVLLLQSQFLRITSLLAVTGCYLLFAA